MKDFEDRAGNVDFETLSAYLDGELDAAERAWVEARLADDPAWRDELDSLKWTVDLLSQTPDIPLPRSFELRVTAAAPARIMTEPTSQPFWRNLNWLYGFLRLSTAATLALLLGVVGFDVWQTGAARSSAPMAAQAPASAPASAPLNAPEAKKPAEAPAAQAPRAAQAPQAPPTAFVPGSDLPQRGGAGGMGAGGFGGGGSGDPPGGGLGATSAQDEGAPIAEARPSPAPAPAQGPASRAAPAAGPGASAAASAPASAPAAAPKPGVGTRGWEIALGAVAIGLALATWQVRKRMRQ